MYSTSSSDMHSRLNSNCAAFSEMPFCAADLITSLSFTSFALMSASAPAAPPAGTFRAAGSAMSSSSACLTVAA